MRAMTKPLPDPDFVVPRLAGWLLVAVLALAAVWFIAPQQLPVSLYKFSLVAVAGVGGYRLDRSLFPYARPDQLLIRADLFVNERSSPFAILAAAAMLRRAVIVGCAMLAMGLGA
jgi:hypothetical protein